jgi:hypothetical protein
VVKQDVAQGRHNGGELGADDELRMKKFPLRPWPAAMLRFRWFAKIEHMFFAVGRL